MTQKTPEKNWRVAFSDIIEHYQFIELWLQCIYADLCGTALHEGFIDMESSGIAQSVKRIRDQAARRGVEVFSDEELRLLEKIDQERTFWIHDCFTRSDFDYKTKTPKEPVNSRLFLQCRRAEEVRDWLLEKHKAMNARRY